MNIYILQLVNYTLSFLMWMIVGRFILLLISGGKTTFLTGLFEKITDPVFKVTKTVLPFVSEKWVPFVSILLIVIIRFALIIAFHPATGTQ
jgi:hypothetical protein